MNRKQLLILIITLLIPWSPIVIAQSLPPCFMQPPTSVLTPPRRGFVTLTGTPCNEQESWYTQDSIWQVSTISSRNLFVYPEGPFGSVRDWTLHIGIGPHGSKHPIRGICLQTSTVGWRTLQAFEDRPLPWLEDIENDGTVDVILWGSFPINGDSDATLAGFGLIAWVYHMERNNALVLNMAASRMLARRIAHEYRTQLPHLLAHPDGVLQQLREDAAQQLEMFADGECKCLENIEH